MNKDHNYFELRRKIDNLVYKFDKTSFNENEYGYKRRDQDFWIRWSEKFGWIQCDSEMENIYGRPWNISPEDQADYPPAGEWVSKKESKSYVYGLVYPNNQGK
ncbi:MAG: hypothetical protein KAH20_13000 [Methylococcales bacterium]|nr:hypothetical protein [Methylococcales bacterium]